MPRLTPPRPVMASKTQTPKMTEQQIADAIRKKAQELWEKSGRKPGKDLENWLQAERIVRSSLK